jgi:hypothetical protein
MSKSKIPKLTISHKFGGAKVEDLLGRALTVYTNMGTAAATFTAPPVPLPTLKQDLDSLTVSAAAAKEGGKKDILQRDKDRHVLEQDLLLLGAYAIKVANGDPAILAASGFMAAPPRQRRAPQQLSQPSVVSIDQGNSGQLLVEVSPIADAYSYEVRSSPLVNGIPGSWTTVSMTIAKTPVSISGLTPGTIYAFQVRALGKLGFTDWSDSATRMCI